VEKSHLKLVAPTVKRTVPEAVGKRRPGSLLANGKSGSIPPEPGTRAGPFHFVSAFRPASVIRKCAFCLTRAPTASRCAREQR
jgi:hypothetical protein